ncbi:MAG: hypothetical protein KatS3mg103_0241 [Phycisphaerales bacterium]|nr:MAG: hypothetical protein KatS3mg103_0241 [Phycisphaerales bacterium]
MALVAPLLVLLTLPGLWLLTLSALLANSLGAWAGLWTMRAPLVSWWAFGVILACTLASDVMDWTAGVLGAKRMGGTRRAMLGAFLGGIAGAVLGTFFLPIPLVGTLVGGAVGAGLVATIVHRTSPEQTWRQSARVGAGASAGWLAAVVFKLALCTGCAVLLVISAWSSW